MDWPPLGERCFEGIQFDIYRRTVEVSKQVRFVQETASSADIVRVYPIFSKSTLVMTREYRHEVEKTVLRVASGTIEDGESPAAAAIRELKEELGFVAESVDALGVTVPTLKVRQKIHHFVVFDPDIGNQRLEPSERIQPWPVAVESLNDLAFSGEVVEDGIIIGLLLLERKLSGRIG